LRLPPALAAGLEPGSAAPKHVSIVGGGIAGLVLAWVLARRGHRIDLHDAADIPNRHNSSWDDGRIIRHAYGTMQGYARQMPLAFAAWRILCAQAGVNGLVPARALYPLRAEGPWQAAVAADLSASGFAARELDEAALGAVPMLRHEGVLRVVEVEGSGLLRAAAIVDALVAWLAAQPGVRLHPQRRLDAASLGALPGDAVVVAVGPGTARLVPQAAGEAGLWVGLHTVSYLMPPHRLASAWASGPILSCRLSDHPSGGVYVLPPRHGADLKVGAYAVTTIPDETWVDAAAPALDPELVDDLMDAAGIAIADFGEYRLLRARHCRAVMAPRDRFVLRPVDQRTWKLSACSTHGFKFAPVNALAIAAMLEERIPPETASQLVGGEVVA
jgi:glycine/D-amino acid oxidase-like deaminating enzyme